MLGSLIQQEQVVGILALALSAEEAKTKWGVTVKEFLELDFNQ